MSFRRVAINYDHLVYMQKLITSTHYSSHLTGHQMVSYTSKQLHLVYLAQLLQVGQKVSHLNYSSTGVIGYRRVRQNYITSLHCAIGLYNGGYTHIMQPYGLFKQLLLHNRAICMGPQVNQQGNVNLDVWVNTSIICRLHYWWECSLAVGVGQIGCQFIIGAQEFSCRWYILGSYRLLSMNLGDEERGLHMNTPHITAHSCSSSGYITCQACQMHVYWSIIVHYRSLQLTQLYNSTYFYASTLFTHKCRLLAHVPQA